MPELICVDRVLMRNAAASGAFNCDQADGRVVIFPA
jgi:hypothetical protein